MLLKLFLQLILVLTLCCSSDLLAGTITPDVPPAKLTAVEALELANKQIPKDAPLRVVAIEWCQTSKFQPRISDGTQYDFQEAPEEWSWFVTFVDAKPDMARNPFPVHVIRVRNNRTTEIPSGTRT